MKVYFYTLSSWHVLLKKQEICINGYSLLGMMGTRAEERKGSNAVKDLLEESSQLLISGVSLFQRIHDLPNVALLSSNHGRLMRMKAHYVNQSEDGFSLRQKECYNEVCFHGQAYIFMCTKWLS